MVMFLNDFIVFNLQSHLLEEMQRVVLLIDGQVGVGGRKAPPILLMEKINPFHVKWKILKLESVYFILYD